MTQNHRALDNEAAFSVASTTNASGRKTQPPSTAKDPRELLTAEDAAELLHMSTRALRARCRRALRREGRQLIAHLGAGVTAYKIGSTWRLRITTTA